MKQTLKFIQPQNCLPKFFVVLIIRTTASPPQSQMDGLHKILELPPCCPNYCKKMRMIHETWLSSSKWMASILYKVKKTFAPRHGNDYNSKT